MNDSNDVVQVWMVPKAAPGVGDGNHAVFLLISFVSAV
jgi:hypothetical protein